MNIEKYNKIYLRLKEAEISITDVLDEDLPGLRRSSVHMGGAGPAAEIMADMIGEELAYRRNLADQKSRDRSSLAMEKLTKALLWVAVAQTVIFLGRTRCGGLDG